MISLHQIRKFKGLAALFLLSSCFITCPNHTLASEADKVLQEASQSVSQPLPQNDFTEATSQNELAGHTGHNLPKETADTNSGTTKASDNITQETPIPRTAEPCTSPALKDFPEIQKKEKPHLLDKKKEEENLQSKKQSARSEEASLQDSKRWTIFLYLCGSEEESKNGTASDSIAALMKNPLPKDVEFIIQTGGTKNWKNPMFKNNRICRWSYSSEGLVLLEELPDASMGSTHTLLEFLKYTAKFPSKYNALIFWGSGAGPIDGVCRDERSKKALSSKDLHDALSIAFPPSFSKKKSPFSLIGFDAGLMGNIETLHLCHRFTDYLLASEDSVPAHAWNYQALSKTLKSNRKLTPEELGLSICKSYLKNCKKDENFKNASLSLFSLNNYNALSKAYRNTGNYLLELSKNDPGALTQFYRNALQAKPYGSDITESSTSLLDIPELAKRNKRLLFKTYQPLADSLKESLSYQVQGNKDRSPRITTLAPLSGDRKDLNDFLKNQDTNEAYRNLYKKFFRDTDFPVKSLHKFPLSADRETVSARLSDKEVASLQDVFCHVFYPSKDFAGRYYIGTSVNLDKNWQRGIFSENFHGKLCTLNSCIILTEVHQCKDGSTLFSIPLKINGVLHNLFALYHQKENKYEIIGARPDKEEETTTWYMPKEGDLLVPQLYYLANNRDKGEGIIDGEAFTVRSNGLDLSDSQITNGMFFLTFEFATPKGEQAFSDSAVVCIKNKLAVSFQNIKKVKKEQVPEEYLSPFQKYLDQEKTKKK